MRTTLDTALKVQARWLIAAAMALAALGTADLAFAKGGDRAEQIAKLKAEQAKIRAENGEDARGSFSFFGLFSDDDVTEGETPSKAPVSRNPASTSGSQ